MQRFTQGAEALFHAHLWPVAEIARGGADVEPVLGAELLGDKAREDRLALEFKRGVYGFQQRANGVGEGQRYARMDCGQIIALKHSVDHFLDREWFAIGDKVGLSGVSARRRERGTCHTWAAAALSM